MCFFLSYVFIYINSYHLHPTIELSPNAQITNTHTEQSRFKNKTINLYWFSVKRGRAKQRNRERPGCQFESTESQKIHLIEHKIKKCLVNELK